MKGPPRGSVSAVRMCTLEEIHTANPSSQLDKAPSLSHKQLPFLNLQSLGHNRINFYYIMHILQRGGSAIVPFYNLTSARNREFTCRKPPICMESISDAPVLNFLKENHNFTAFLCFLAKVKTICCVTVPFCLQS